MRVQEAWSVGLSGSGVTVAVVDDGLQLNHPDLRNNIVQYALFWLMTYQYYLSFLILVAMHSFVLCFLIKIF